MRTGYRIPDSGSYFCLLLHGVYDLGELTDFSCLDGSYRGAVEAIDTAGGLRGLDGLHVGAFFEGLGVHDGAGAVRINDGVKVIL